MPWYPGAVRRPVTRFNPGGSNATRITARRAIFHTAVSGARSLFDYFNQAGNPCSTWYVAADGYCEQYVDTDYRAPAQLEGNHDCLSWESQDMGAGFPAWSGSDVPAWTAAQVERLADMAAWVNRTHGIPLALLPDSVNGRTGFGYHRLGVNPWRVPNGELWSNATGKVCPGDRRIAQIPAILTLAREGDTDMPITEAEFQRINLIVHDQVLAVVLRSAESVNYFTARAEAGAAAALNAADVVDEAALAAALAPLLPPGVALTPDDVAAIAAAAAVTVNDELASRTSPQVAG